MDKRAPPNNYDTFSKDTNIRSQFRALFEALTHLGKFTTQCLQSCAEEDEDFNRQIAEQEENSDDLELGPPTTFMAEPSVLEEVKTLYNSWLVFFVSNTDSLNEVRGNRYTLGACIFVEMTRLHGLLNRAALLEEQDNLACFDEALLSTESYMLLYSLSKTKHTVWVEISNSYKESLDKEEESDDNIVELHAKVQKLWITPIMQFTQSQTRILLWFLTQQVNLINTVDRSIVQEYRRVFNTLWLRISQFYERTMPVEVLDEHTDDDVSDSLMVTNGLPNMNFSVFCSLYAGGLLRRFFYYDELVGNKLEVHLRPTSALPTTQSLAESTRNWICTLVHSFADEAFEDMYNSIVPEGYNFLGDDRWFRYYWPHKIHSRGACINNFRPHLHKRFFSESTLNRETVLKAYKSSHVARLFILKAIDEYLKIQLARVQWMNAVVVYNEDIEMASSILEQSRVPVILQVFSSFWLYDECCVHVTDDLFEVIGLWFYMLKSKYGCMLYDVDMSLIIDDVFSPPTRAGK